MVFCFMLVSVEATFPANLIYWFPHTLVSGKMAYFLSEVCYNYSFIVLFFLGLACFPVSFLDTPSCFYTKILCCLCI